MYVSVELNNYSFPTIHERDKEHFQIQCTYPFIATRFNSPVFPYVLFIYLLNTVLGVAVFLFNFIHNSHKNRNRVPFQTHNIIFITLFTQVFSAAKCTCMN